MQKSTQGESELDVQFSICEQLPRRNVQRFRDGLVFKAHRLCVSLNSLGLRVIKRRRRYPRQVMSPIYTSSLSPSSLEPSDTKSLWALNMSTPRDCPFHTSHFKYFKTLWSEAELDVQDRLWPSQSPQPWTMHPNLNLSSYTLNPYLFMTACEALFLLFRP